MCIIEHRHPASMRLRTVCTRYRVNGMKALDSRLVLVPVGRLDDLLELSRLAAERLPNDPVGSALRGAAAEVRASSLIEPS